MFIPATGLDYRIFLDALHDQMRFDWYLEIGSQTGRSLAKSRSPSIAVDPQFRIKFDVAGNKPHLHLFQATSDDFFAAGHLKSLKAKPGLSFLDGMHLFEYLLRDFINTEAAGTPASVIVMHDCCPFGHGMTTRNIERIPRGPWTGDVWKLIPILQEYRPDLTIQVLNCAPTGLVVVSDLKPKNRVLIENYDRIVERYTDLRLADHGVERFYASFAYTDAVAMANDGFQTFRPAARDFVAAEKPLVAPPPPPPAEAATIQKVSVHNVDLYFGHRVLSDFAQDLSRCLTGPLSDPVDVYVGVHVIDRPIDTGHLTVGIQTEQYHDRTGRTMWRIPRGRFRQRHASFYDVLLDLSADNAPAYDFLGEDLRAKLMFGPHIFPADPIDPDIQPGAAVFFGAMNERRRGLLTGLQAERAVDIAPHGTFGRTLDTLIAGQSAVLNLHFREGEYSEYPRFLKAYLRGKPVISEPLAPPLIAGQHYYDLSARPTAAATRKIFRNLANLATAHSFPAFLEGCLTRARMRKAG